MNHQISQCRGQANAVVEFAQFLPVRVRHALGQIHEQVAGDICFGLVFFDIKTISLGKDQPINVFRIVTLRVTAMLTELDAKALERAGIALGWNASVGDRAYLVAFWPIVTAFAFRAFLRIDHECLPFH